MTPPARPVFPSASLHLISMTRMKLASLLVIAGLFGVGAAHAQVPDTAAADTGAFALPPIEVVGTIRKR